MKRIKSGALWRNRKSEKFFGAKCENIFIEMRGIRFTALRKRTGGLSLIFLLLLPAVLYARGPIDLPRLGGPIVLDGNSDEPAWEAVAPLPLTMYQPTYKGSPTERTEIRVAYDDNHLFAAVRFYDSEPSKIRVSGFFNAGYGSFYDGTRSEVGISALWNISRYFGFYLEYGADFIRFTKRNQGFDAHILRLRVESALNSRLALNGFIQFNSVGDFLTSNLRFRYNFAEGNDLWIVYNEGINLDRQAGDDLLPHINDRTIMVKFTTTFNL